MALCACCYINHCSMGAFLKPPAILCCSCDQVAAWLPWRSASAQLQLWSLHTVLKS